MKDTRLEQQIVNEKLIGTPLFEPTPALIARRVIATAKEATKLCARPCGEGCRHIHHQELERWDGME